MYDNITATATQTSPAMTTPQQTSKDIDDAFINTLRERFAGDDIKDASEHKSINGLKFIDSEALFGVKDVDGCIRLEDIAKAAETDLANFKTMLDQALDEAGITKNPPFEIESDSSGNLCINSDHPDKEKIEKILNEVPNLEQTFKRISANTSLVEAGKQYTKHAKAYELDPQSAVRQFEPIFEQLKNAVFSIFVDDEGYSPKLTASDTGEELITESSNNNPVGL